MIDGVYTLIDPTETARNDDDDDLDDTFGRQRSASITERNTIRMPPSLTLSKIRSLKSQALMACIRSKIEISTLALACVYFERLCLDCRSKQVVFGLLFQYADLSHTHFISTFHLS